MFGAVKISEAENSPRRKYFHVKSVQQPAAVPVASSGRRRPPAPLVWGGLQSNHRVAAEEEKERRSKSEKFRQQSRVCWRQGIALVVEYFN